ncbi:ricin-type beta-trefoil lectin domain protein [Enterococcus thailandicus]|uniref:RICIN domain-containing protein n=1 Tax=Enterococcus thailandicus TaxID=417368 RepID=UPI0022EBB696|nr:RICIN domain-containing protein [Enterococcus thailandicus]MDA3974541.1 ricin-type beta-trefoil lectin domain protein [Enterococcus thailandicus]MDA3977027.1 ricin-type beta-trefoil lectin domain protein [Enterococcus thailandicus]MDA3981993.1 ricin-type beta-trefoil lectin domain protein [Enterococcus thailandicus]
MKKIIGLFFTLLLLFPQVMVYANETEQGVDAKSSEINYGMEYRVTKNYEYGPPPIVGWGIQEMRVTEDAIEFDVDMADEIYHLGKPKEIQTLSSGPGGQYQVKGKRILREIKNGRRYYTMRFKRDQHINGSNTYINIETFVNEFALNELIIVLDTKIPENYNDTLVSIQSKMDPWKVIDWDQTHNAAVIWDNNGDSNQKWYLTYHQEKNAYSIHNYNQTSYCLIENSDQTVGVKPNVSNNDSALWQLVREGNHDNGLTYYLKNVQSGRVLDIDSSILKNGNNILTYSNYGTENQKFILHIEGYK